MAQKLLTLSTSHWFSGIAPGAHFENGGIWYKAKGISPFVLPRHETDESGLLQTCPSPTDITSGIGGTPKAYALRITGASAGTLYYQTSTDLASLDVGTNGTPSSIASVSDLSTGMEIFKTNTEDLFYWQNTQIGKYGDLGGTPSTSNNWYTTNVQTTDYHPSHQFLDKVFWGNKYYVGTIYNASGTPTATSQDLDIPIDYTITCLEDDGQYLVIGATKNQGSNTLYAGTKVFFWDTFTSSWQREWEIPDPNITALKRVGGFIYAVCGRGLYIFNFSTPPEKVKTLSSAQVPSFGFSNSVGRLGNAIVWGGSELVNLYGKVMENTPTAYHQFLASMSGQVSMVVMDGRVDNAYIGTAQPKLYRFDLSAGGATNLSAETRYISLGDSYRINFVRIILGEPMASGDSLNVELQGDEDTTAVDFGTAAFATQGAVRVIDLYGSILVESLKIILNYDGGNPKVKEVIVYGDREGQQI